MADQPLQESASQLIVCGACSYPLAHEAEPCPGCGTWGRPVPGIVGVNVEIPGGRRSVSDWARCHRCGHRRDEHHPGCGAEVDRFEVCSCREFKPDPENDPRKGDRRGRTR